MSEERGKPDANASLGLAGTRSTPVRSAESIEPTLTPSQAIAEATTSTPASSARPTNTTGATPTPARASASTGALPARYALTGTIGSGGMGEVLLATDRQIDRDVAIKRMRVEPTPGMVARFVREAKIQGRLEHPAIVPVHELATDADGRPFFVMKRLTGTTLAEIITRPGDWTRQKLLRAFADVCLAIEFAHKRRIIHRDLKPANIMLGDYGEVYVLDWGVARLLDDGDEPAEASEGSQPAREGETEVGAILGTPGYMAPEQLRGDRVDESADVYALGCILFEILAGQPLLPRDRSAAVPAHEDIDARPSSRSPASDIPPELDEASVVALARDPRERLTARELAIRIEAYLDGDRDLALRKSIAAAHIASARSALASGDGIAERAIAMRQAGRAIALDPHASEGAELVARLMLEPPREIPREVDERVLEIESETSRKKLRMLVPVEFSFLLFVPIVLFMGLRSASSLVMLLAPMVLNISLMLVLARRKRPNGTLQIYLSATCFGLLILALSRLFSPFLVAPGIAAVTLLTFSLDPLARWVPMFLGFLAAVLLPLVAELLGVVSRTTMSLGGDLRLHSELVTMYMPHTAVALAVFTTALLAIAGYIASQMAKAHRSAIRSLELQAWHLRQLVS